MRRMRRVRPRMTASYRTTPSTKRYSLRNVDSRDEDHISAHDCDHRCSGCRCPRCRSVRRGPETPTKERRAGSALVHPGVHPSEGVGVPQHPRGPMIGVEHVQPQYPEYARVAQAYDNALHFVAQRSGDPKARAADHLRKRAIASELVISFIRDHANA